MTALDEIEPLVEEPWRVDPHDFAVHVSDGKWIAWPHLSYIASRIADAFFRGNGRLIINMPPGHGKSELLSHWLPTWVLENWPEQRVILTSHSAELASHWGRIVRNEFEWNERLTTRLMPDSKAADRWNTPQGGGMKTDGVGGGITGFRANLILVDDPHPTWEAINSEAHRKKVSEWFDGTLRDRAEPNATIVVLMHRWHEQDLCGHLLGKDAAEWEVIRLPALAEADDPLGRAEGEPLCPQRYDRQALNAMQKAVGSLVWHGKYGQSPRPPEGNYFKREWFKTVPRDRVPRLNRIARVWDLAATVQEGGNDPDWLVGTKMGRAENGDKYILHVHRSRTTPEGVEATIKQHAASDGRECMIRIEQEGAASGKIVAHHYTKMLDAYDVQFTTVAKSSKLVRAGPFNAACERGEVFLVDGPWITDWIEELAAFPNGSHDDQVDSGSGAYGAVTDSIELESAFFLASAG
jgi:predicted phage terminase large subunit-like protein